jgi:hypothetical protein
MRRAVEVNGRTYTISATVVLQGRRGTVATCNELPDLMELGDNPDDALRRAADGVERMARDPPFLPAK